MVIQYKLGGAELLHQVKPLWERQRDFHAEISISFSEFFISQQFSCRREEIENKVYDNKLLVILAVDASIKRNVGYCVAVIDCKGVGEIESIYVHEAYRLNGIASKMVNSTVSWMNEYDAKEKILIVASGNENVINFYKGFGFQPFSIKLKETP